LPTKAKPHLAALFLLSMALIAFEIAVMRVFGVGSWSNFGHMVISIALLGFGLAGTLLTIIRERVAATAERWLFATALLFGPAVALAHVAAQRIDFNPILIATDRAQLLRIGLYYVVYGLPFLVGALFIGVAFVHLQAHMHRLYFWNLLGSGLGGLLILLCMYVLPPDRLLVPVLLLGLAAAAAASMQVGRRSGRLQFAPAAVGLSALATLAALVLVLAAGGIHVSAFKGISYARHMVGAREVYSSFGPVGQVDIFQGPFHFAPGLSINAALNVAAMPGDDAYLAMYIDGSGPIGLIRKLSPAEQDYIGYLAMAAPYQVLQQPRVLLIQLGGAINVATALHYEAPEVWVTESNPEVLRAVRDAPVIRRFNRDLARDPRLRIRHAEGRAFAATTPERFDLVQIGLIDSTGLSQTGGYAVDENYVYTVEGIRDYLRCLRPNGWFAVTVWDTLDPPRNVPKLLATVVEALRRKGAVDPGSRLFAFYDPPHTATILVKQGAISPAEVHVLRTFCDDLSFTTVYYPGIAPQDASRFVALLTAYGSLFRQVETPAGTGEASPAGTAPEGQPEPAAGAPTASGEIQSDTTGLYRGMAQWLLAGRQKELFRRYLFDMRPATDNRPYYTAYLKPGMIGSVLDELERVSAEWGYLLLWGTLLQSLVFGAVVIAVPLALRCRELTCGSGRTWGVLLYFACLGLGYMLVEMFLIQRFVFFLADPIYSVSVVICALLILSGLGSLYSDRFAADRSRGIRLAVAVVVVTLALYAVVLPPLLRGLLGLPLPVKMLISVVLIAPVGFFLGFPFPTGLSALSQSRPGMLPWAWGLNGALSVTGAVLGRLTAISFGFTAVLALSAALYVLALLVFRANEQAGPEPGSGGVYAQSP